MKNNNYAISKSDLKRVKKIQRRLNTKIYAKANDGTTLTYLINSLNWAIGDKFKIEKEYALDTKILLRLTHRETNASFSILFSGLKEHYHFFNQQFNSSHTIRLLPPTTTATNPFRTYYITLDRDYE